MSEGKIWFKLKGDASDFPSCLSSCLLLKSIFPTASCYGSVCQSVSIISLCPDRFVMARLLMRVFQGTCLKHICTALFLLLVMSLGSEFCNFLQHLHFLNFIIFHGRYFPPSDYLLIAMSLSVYKVHSTLVVWKCSPEKKLHVSKDSNWS